MNFEENEIQYNYHKCISLHKYIVFGIRFKLFQCRMKLNRLNNRARSNEATGGQKVQKHNIFEICIFICKHHSVGYHIPAIRMQNAAASLKYSRRLIRAT